jgi:hypothetical protein
VTELYAYVVADADEDDEGVPAFLGPASTWMPMMGADRERAEQLRPVAEEMARRSGKEIKLVRSVALEVVDVVAPF